MKIVVRPKKNKVAKDSIVPMLGLVWIGEVFVVNASGFVLLFNDLWDSLGQIGLSVMND